MNFEINDGKEHIPDEDDIYGVNDIEERERFESLFGGYTPQEERIRRRKIRIRVLAVLVIIALTAGILISIPGHILSTIMRFLHLS